jgi:hypothetical protein
MRPAHNSTLHTNYNHRRSARSLLSECVDRHLDVRAIHGRSNMTLIGFTRRRTCSTQTGSAFRSVIMAINAGRDWHAVIQACTCGLAPNNAGALWA